VTKVKSVLKAALAATVLSIWATAAHADILARVSIAQQTMNVYVDGELAYTWPVSTARKGYSTPRGSFRAQWLDPMHYSSIYENAPMPHSVFFKDGFAIHGSYETRFLGHPVSHGCVRLSPGNAATLYGLIEDQGLEVTRVVIR
jgi:lipoprotein-anchoring transpeptidase ErfK/SrfK